MISGTLDIGNGVQLYYQESGKGQPLVLIHGMWGSGRFFTRQMADLSKHYRCITFDLRGHGRSTMTPSQLTVPTYARDLKILMKKLDIKNPVLLGWSMGAFIAWDFYKQFGPGDVRGLVVVDQAPTDYKFSDYPEGMIGFAELRDWHEQVMINKNEFMRMVLPMMFHNPPGPGDTEWMWADMCAAPEAIAASVFLDQSLRDYRADVQGYPIPTLVCFGGHSPQSMVGAKQIVDGAARGALKIFENSGHCLFYEEADLFNQAVHGFIQGL
jgi:pimeloyl-ACP methyl ester carboxylesterase